MVTKSRQTGEPTTMVAKKIAASPLTMGENRAYLESRGIPVTESDPMVVAKMAYDEQQKEYLGSANDVIDYHPEFHDPEEVANPMIVAKKIENTVHDMDDAEYNAAKNSNQFDFMGAMSHGTIVANKFIGEGWSNFDESDKKFASAAAGVVATGGTDPLADFNYLQAQWTEVKKWFSKLGPGDNSKPSIAYWDLIQGGGSYVPAGHDVLGTNKNASLGYQKDHIIPEMDTFLKGFPAWNMDFNKFQSVMPRMLELYGPGTGDAFGNKNTLLGQTIYAKNKDRWPASLIDYISTYDPNNEAPFINNVHDTLGIDPLANAPKVSTGTTPDQSATVAPSATPSIYMKIALFMGWIKPS